MKLNILLYTLFFLVFVGCSSKEETEKSIVKAGIVEPKEFPKDKMQLFKAGLGTLELDSAFLAMYEYKSALIWYNSELKLTSEAKQFIHLLENAKAYGTDTSHYQLSKLKEAVKANDYSTVEILLSKNYLIFGKNISYGQILNVKPYYEFERRLVDTNWINILAKAEENNRIPILLAKQPQYSEYLRLQKGLEKYLKSVILSDSVIDVVEFKKDSALSYQTALQALAIHGLGLKQQFSDSMFKKAIIQFQYQHGLTEDGVVGRSTAKELSKSTNQFYKQAQVALEKWRWMKDFEPKHIFVNIATYKLKCYVENKIQVEHKVVVGTSYTQTPELDSELERMITYPFWHVPRSIIEGELVDKAKKDPTYLARNGYELFSDKQNVNSSAINWEEGSNYSFRQKGGNSNALGVIKFIFKNRYSVYFHDTPSKRFFEEGTRSYSHGCVRLHEPLLFADYILKNDSANKVSIDSVKSLIESRTRKSINLNKKNPIHIRYNTVEADTNNVIRFYKDVYGKEQELLKFNY